MHRVRCLLAFTIALLVAPLLANAQVQFGAPHYTIIGGAPFGLAVGDFNQDGKPDYATANQAANTAAHRISVVFNQGGGQFGSIVHYAMTEPGMDIAACDFNEDGKPDLIALDQKGNLYLMRNTGGGVFQSTTLPLGVDAITLAVTDLDRNGTDDIVVCTNNGGVSVLRGDGMGAFSPPTVSPTNARPYGVAVADFNNDKRPDLAVTTASGLGLLLQQPNGSFASPPVLYQTGISSWYLKTGDFNRDGRADIVVVNANGIGINVLLGNGNATLQPPVFYATGQDSVRATLGDFNADGIPDIAVANFTSNDVSVLMGNGNGSFQNARSIGVNYALYSVATGDFDGDGRLDILAGWGLDRAVSFLRNTSPLYTLSGTVTLEDCHDPEQAITLELRPTSYVGPTLKRKVTLTQTGENSGKFQVTGIPSGHYTVAVNGFSWLRRTQNVAILNDVTNFAITLPTGDLNGDDSVDVLDLDILIRHFDQGGDP